MTGLNGESIMAALEQFKSDPSLLMSYAKSATISQHPIPLRSADMTTDSHTRTVTVSQQPSPPQSDDTRTVTIS